MSEIEEIKKNLKTDKLIMGTEETIKNLKLGKVKKVFLASNCEHSIVRDISHYTKIGNVDLTTLEIPNDELGVICRKPFSISVLCLMK
jgi:large subunit ribosomal protein L30e